MIFLISFILSLLIFKFLGALLDLQQVPKQPKPSEIKESDLMPFKSIQEFYFDCVENGFDLLKM